MAKQTIFLGNQANDGTGDSLRVAFDKTNDNFTELYDNLNQTPTLGNLKISGSTLGTIGNSQEEWGNYNLYLDPGGESNAYIFIPSVEAQASGTSLHIVNAGDPSSVVLVRGRGNVQISTNEGENEKIFSFYDDGKLELPVNGDIVDSNGNSVLTSSNSNTLSSVSLTGGSQVGAVVSLACTNGPNANWFSTGLYANGINFTITVVDGSVSAFTINDGGTGHYVGETFSVPGTHFGGVSPDDDMNFQISEIDSIVYTELDLTKSIQKLADGYYTLADGVEGQIMYLTRQTGQNGTLRIYVTNQSRTNGNEYTNNFIYNILDVGVLLYTDNAWQASNVYWD